MSPVPAVRIWSDEGQEPDEPNAYGSDLEALAEEFAERRFADSDYPETQTIMVREASGKLHVFDVTAEPATVFRAKERT